MRRLLFLMAAAGALLGGAVGCRCSSCSAGGGHEGVHLCTRGVCDCDHGPQYGCHHDHAHSNYAPQGHAAPGGISVPASPMPAAPESLKTPPKGEGR